MVATSAQGLNQASTNSPKRSGNRLRDVFLLAALLAAGGTALILGLRFAGAQEIQALDTWATRLDTTAQATARNIGNLTEAKSAALLELANNVSLRVYLWNLISTPESEREGQAELDYLRGLLTARTDSGTRNATRNDRFTTVTLLDTALNPIVSTLGLATPDVAPQLAGQAIATRTRQLLLTETASGTPVILFAAPIAPPPGAAGTDALAGVLLTTQDARELFVPLIRDVPGYFASDATLLVAATGAPAVPLTGSEELTLPPTEEQMGFRALTLENGVAVLQTTQRVPGTGWALIRRVDAELALQEMRQRVAARWIALLLSVAVLACLFWAWRERGRRLEERAEMLPMVVGQSGFAGNTPENQLLNKLVASLIDVIDLHDPYSAFHSARLAELCRAMAVQMNLDQTAINNLVTAAMLANVGKIALPRELLTKRDELSEPEQELIQSHVEEGVEILRKLEFEDPILKAIAEKQETLDGSGYPSGISADHITLPGRILAVANAYVALVSPRAYRDAVSSDEALRSIAKEVDVRYDREAFQALERVIENGEGISEWDDIHMRQAS